MPDSNKDIVLAFSGGLDTSFCIPWLLERGYRITTLFVDTGGVPDDERAYIEQRALSLGAHKHITQDAGEELWSSFVVPFVQAGEAYQNQYPLLCSDRYIIVKRMCELAEDIDTCVIAHGCTAAGNDQFRFDQSIKSLGDFQIIAPIRAIQSETDTLRAYEEQYLRERGVEVRGKTSRYTINENILGVTISGSEIDEFNAPSDETYCITRKPGDWPKTPLRMTIGFVGGVPVTIDGRPTPGPDMLATLNESFGAYGVGRGIYTGDTTIGLKGRIAFECPGLTALRTAHRALEEATLTKLQNAFKPTVARRWVELVYEGFFFDPLREDTEAFIRSTQQFVSGQVTVETHGGACLAVAVDTPHVLVGADATYAQGAAWTAEQAEGFIKLYGQGSVLAQVRAQRSVKSHKHANRKTTTEAQPCRT